MVESLLSTAAPTETAAPVTPSVPSGTAPQTPAASTPSTPAKDGATTTTPPATAPATGAPASYELKIPEGVTFDGEARTAFEAMSRKHNLSNTAAQELLSEVTPKLAAQRAAQIEQQIKDVRAGWEAESVNHPEFGGHKFKETLALAEKTYSLDGPELLTFLKETGLLVHPRMMSFARKIGTALSPDRVVTASSGAPSAGRKSDGEVFFSKVDKQ